MPGPRAWRLARRSRALATPAARRAVSGSAPSVHLRRAAISSRTSARERMSASQARAADRPLWLVVTTEQLAPSIQPLADRRRTEGLDAVVVTEDPASALKGHPHPAYLLLVGDVPGPGETPDAAWHVPALELPLYTLALGNRLGSWQRLVGLVVVINAVTHPLLWFAMPRIEPYAAYFAIGETAVVA